MPTQDLRNIAYPESTGEAVIALLVLEHPSMATPLRLTDAGGTYNATVDAYTIEVDSELYYCAPIQIIPPGMSDEAPQGRIVVPNVDQRIGSSLRTLAGPMSVTITAVLDSDPTVIVGGPFTQLKLQNVVGDAVAIEGDISLPQLDAETWPKQWINPGKYLAAFR